MQTTADAPRIHVFYDGACPLCMREVGMLQRRDRKHHRIRFTDIAAPGFDPAAWGKTQNEFMARIQAQLPDGRWIDGVEVFRQLYSAVGLGALLAITRVPGINWVAERAYDVFAKNRLRITGRKDCTTDACAVPPARLMLVANAAATWLMVGVIWTIQLVHYPMFDSVAPERFVVFHAAHSTRITWVVAPAMLIELVTSGVLAWHGSMLAYVGLGCAAATWVLTAVLSVPAHNALARGFEQRAHSRLVATNWLRTAVWTAHGVIVAAMLRT